MEEPQPQLPKPPDWSNKTIVGVMLIIAGLILLYAHYHQPKVDYGTLQYLNQQADSLRGASREKDKLIVALQRDINRVTDTIKIIEKKQTIRYDNYIQATANLRPDSTIDTSFAAARLRFRERWEQGVFFER